VVPTVSTECIHGLGPVAACTICNGREKGEQAAQAEAYRTFAAKYEGQCRECNLPIVVGQIIAWRPDEMPIHERCAPGEGS
jgi:hypothetical protein